MCIIKLNISIDKRKKGANVIICCTKPLVMVRAWYMDDDPSDQTTEHHRTPPMFLTVKELYDLTGVEYVELNVDTHATDAVFAKLKKDRGYTYEDVVICSGESKQALKNLYQEHLHTNEGIRLILDGSGYFDFRDKNDEWIRMEVVAGDTIIIPSGLYHRFSLDKKKYIMTKRFFIGEPVLLPYNRPADDMLCRKEYLKKMAAS